MPCPFPPDSPYLWSGYPVSARAMLQPRTILDPVEVELARALGYPDDATALPHLSYIIGNYTIRYATEDYLRLIIHVIEHFTLNQPGANGNAGSRTIQTLMEELERDGFREVFADTATNPEDRQKEVDDHVMCIIGRWTMLLNHFELRDKQRKNKCRVQPSREEGSHYIRPPGLWKDCGAYQR